MSSGQKYSDRDYATLTLHKENVYFPIGYQHEMTVK